MNHIKNSRHSEAAQAAVAHARHVPNKAKAETLFSIAKLSAILASDSGPKAKTLNLSDKSPAGTAARDAATPSPHTARLTYANSSSTPVRGTAAADDHPADSGLESAVIEANANLAVLRSQELLQGFCSRYAVDLQSIVLSVKFVHCCFAIAVSSRILLSA